MTTIRQVTPLLTIESEAFAKQYELGVWWSMYGDEQGQGLVRDSYFVTNMKTCIEHGYFDGQHDDCLPHLGFYLGMYHGGILSPSTEEQRPDITTLVALHNQDAASGYYVGREWYFTEAQPHERRYTEHLYIEQLQHLALESPNWKAVPPEKVWYHAIGCLLGEISGELFPMTEHDRSMWAEIDRQHREAYEQWKASQERHTEPLPVLSLRQEA